MRLIADFGALDFAPVPWSVPDIAVVGRGKGRPRRIAKVPRSFRKWRDYLRVIATSHKAAGPIYTGPLLLDITFLRRTPPGRRHGELWCPEVRWNPEAGDGGRYVKHGPLCATGDLTNLLKGTEDVLQGIFFGDDGQTCVTVTRRLFGPHDGVQVQIHAIDPGDFPGHGDPVAA